MNGWLLIITVFLSVYGEAWWRIIWFVLLAPATLVFIASVPMLWLRPPGIPAWAVWLGFALEVVLAAGTAAWWGPLMARLADPPTGLVQPLYRKLMRTHWIRALRLLLTESSRSGC